MNIELLDRVLAHIDADPLQWNQHSWHHCVAAHTAEVMGLQWATNFEDPAQYDFVVNEDGMAEHVAYYAERVLGLNLVEADRLFALDNTREDLQILRNWMVGEEPRVCASV